MPYIYNSWKALSVEPKQNKTAHANVKETLFIG